MGLTYTLFAFAVVVLGGLGYTGAWCGAGSPSASPGLTETYLEAGLSLLVAFALLYLILVSCRRGSWAGPTRIT